MTVAPCETSEMPTFEPSDKLKAAIEHVKAEKKRAKDIDEAATQELYDAIAREMIERPDVGNTAIGNFFGYSAGHIRRIGRKRGVPAKVDVEPPKRRGRQPSPEPETASQDQD